MAPFHPIGTEPDARDRARPRADRSTSTASGFDEAWVGEHHSAGYEIIASPEVFIARRRRAHEAHQARHRRELAAVPPPADARRPHGAARPPHPRPRDARRRPGSADVRRAHARHPRRRAAAAHGGGARRDHGAAARRDRHDETDWFTLQRRAPAAASRTATRASTSPSRRRSRRPAPRAPASTASGCCRSPRPRSRAWTCSATTGTTGRRSALEHGHVADRSKWRLVGPMHLADTREQAERDVEYGIAQFSRYFTHVLPGGPGAGRHRGRDHREQPGVRLRGHRHARRRGREDRGARRGERRRVRRVPALRPRLGEPRREAALLRTVRAVRDAALHRASSLRRPRPATG